VTLIYLPRHVDQLISEIKSEWAPSNDPDMHRVADAFPLAVLEAAYVRKLKAEPADLKIGRAESVSQKLRVMRTIYLAWLRQPQLRLGQFIVAALCHSHPEYTADDAVARLFYQEDGALAELVEKRYVSKE
jgi:hypothetical protein